MSLSDKKEFDSLLESFIFQYLMDLKVTTYNETYLNQQMIDFICKSFDESYFEGFIIASEEIEFLIKGKINSLLSIKIDGTMDIFGKYESLRKKMNFKLELPTNYLEFYLTASRLVDLIDDAKKNSNVLKTHPKTANNPKGAGRTRLYEKGKEPVKMSFSGPPQLFEDVKNAYKYKPTTISKEIVGYLNNFFENPTGFFLSLAKPFDIYDFDNIKSSGFSIDEKTKQRISDVCLASGISQKKLLNSIYYQMLLDSKNN